jgi:hypothetical protein
VFPALRGYTVTNWQIITEIEYMLLEPPTPTVWTGTDQFTLSQVNQALQRRRDLFLQLTGAVKTRAVTNYPAPPADGRIDLDETVLTVERAAWRPTTTQFLRILRRHDEWGGDHYRPLTWRTASVTTPPMSYSTSATPPLQLQLMPPAADAGDLDLISTSRGALIIPTVESVLGIPDDYAWVVKYGVLADLLGGDGLQTDLARAQYCQTRWLQGISMATSASVVLSATINDTPCLIAALTDADSYSPLWQLLGGVPQRLILTGQNLLGTVPVANADGYVIGLEVVRNAPVPTASTDILQIGADLYDTILDLAQCAATFKEGGAQNASAQGLYQRAASVAGVTLAIQQASQPARSPLLDQQRVQDLAAPRALDPVEIP